MRMSKLLQVSHFEGGLNTAITSMFPVSPPELLGRIEGWQVSMLESSGINYDRRQMHPAHWFKVFLCISCLLAW